MNSHACYRASQFSPARSRIVLLHHATKSYIICNVQIESEVQQNNRPSNLSQDFHT